jgi:hypothetical protein
MPAAHWASTVQFAGTQPYSWTDVHGAGSVHGAPGAHGAAPGQLEAPTTAHSKPTWQAGPVPQLGSGAKSAKDSELNIKTAEALNAAGMKRSCVMGRSPRGGGSASTKARLRARTLLTTAPSVPVIFGQHET